MIKPVAAGVAGWRHPEGMGHLARSDSAISKSSMRETSGAASLTAEITPRSGLATGYQPSTSPRMDPGRGALAIRYAAAHKKGF
jgi:hypothetical protein